VYEQVSKLFATAPDLIGEFKQFLPEDRDSQIFTSLMEADPLEKNTKRGGPAKDQKKKRGTAGDTKTAAKVSVTGRLFADISDPRPPRKPTAHRSRTSLPP
jgi:histone deacetylase complex regulatory component SIN3